MPPTTIRDHVRRLTERGDIRKVPNPADGRSYHLVLSPQGEQLMDARLAGGQGCATRGSRRTSRATRRAYVETRAQPARRADARALRASAP